MNSHRHRRSIRFPNYNYSQTGMYFITICTHNKICRFGTVEQQIMQLNPMGERGSMQWQALPQRFTHIEMDAFVVMPNHVHGIINITANPDSTPKGRPLHQNGRPQGSPLPGAHITDAHFAAAPTVGDMVGAYKSLCVHDCLQWINVNEPCLRLGKLWQRNYWEHVIHNEQELNNIRQYITDNPRRWHEDALYLKE